MNSDHHLHVPAPPARPGGAPDFSYLRLSPAGAVPRPSPTTPALATRSLAESLVRVLDDDGVAVGGWDPGLGDDTLLAILRAMQLTRAMDERLVRAQRQGKVTFYIPSTGEEAVSVAAAHALQPGDMLFPTYRTQGLQLARGRALVDLMCQCLSNTRDMCRGRQMPVFYHWREGNIFSVSGNLATQLPQAVGWAMAAAIRATSDVAVAWTGEGSTAEADFHHAMTFAAVYRAPVIINVVNNQWAISSCQAVAGGDEQTFAARGPGYGVAGIRVDGNDVLAVYAVTRWAAERARAGEGATLIEFVTYRGGPHSTSDEPSRYRPKGEWTQFPLGDPIARLARHLTVRGAWSERQQAALQAELADEVAAAWEQALGFGTLSEGPRLDPMTLFDQVYEESTPALERQRAQLRAQLPQEQR